VGQSSVRLQKLLRDAGFGSRRHCEEIITAGRVRVNGKTVATLGASASPSDRVTVDGKHVRPSRGRPRYILFHKPDGVASASGDRLGRRTVFDILPKEFSAFFMAGRLDYHTTGLMLLTNDGDFAQMLAHPRFGVEKVYVVKVTGVPSGEKLERIARGMVIDGERCLPVGIRSLDTSPKGHLWLELTLREGKKNQIRIMFDQIGHSVQKLKRVAIGPFTLKELKPGEHGELSARAVQRIKEEIARARPADRGEWE